MSFAKGENGSLCHCSMWASRHVFCAFEDIRIHSSATEASREALPTVGSPCLETLLNRACCPPANQERMRHPHLMGDEPGHGWGGRERVVLRL